jgi:DNA-binding transcriptional ArsR family regulator
MGTTKSEGFSEEVNELALLFKAMGHPARIAIIQFLRTQEKCICTDLVNELPLAQPTISQHLKELKEAGLIKGNIDGASVCYCIDEKVWNKALTQLNDLFEKINSKSVSCCS